MGVIHAKEPFLGKGAVQKDWKPFSEVTARVVKVHFDGVNRTKDDVFVDVVGDLLEAQTFEDIVLRAHDVRKQLESLQAFSSVDIIVDTSQGSYATPDGFEVTFDLVERSRAAGNINVSVGNNDGSLLFRFLLPNMFGRGEAVQTEYQYGKKTSGFNIQSTKPILSWAKPRINQVIFGEVTEFPFSGYLEKSKGIGAELLFESSPQVQHTLRWDGIWRNISSLSSATPFGIREEAGHTVKSSLKHILSMDQRDNPCLPSRGSFFHLYQEYAGLGGNVSFLKHEIQYQINKSILQDIVFQATLTGGLIRTLGSDQSVRINDRFFLGGPLSLRGFKMHGVGPHEQNYSTGAEAYWAGGLHLYAPLPFRPLKHVLDKVCRTHIFLNTGNIGNFAFTDDYHYNATMLLSQLRWSCGIGLILSVAGIARFEINYCIPLRNEPGDRINRGLQFGIGIRYL